MFFGFFKGTPFNFSLIVISSQILNTVRALDYKPQILGPKIEEFSCLIHKLSVLLTALQQTVVKNGVKHVQALVYKGKRTVFMIGPKYKEWIIFLNTYWQHVSFTNHVTIVYKKLDYQKLSATEVKKHCMYCFFV